MTRKISLIIAMLITYLVNAQGIDESLYVFDFGLNYMPVKERTTYLYEQGFRGVTFAIKDEQQIKKLKAYLNTEEVKSGKFSVPIIYIVYEFGQKESLNPIWKEVLTIAPKMPLWVIILNRDGLATKEKTLNLFNEMTTEAAKTESDIVIYPHDNTFIESIEESLPFIKELDKDNLKLTFHLCHEIRAGNGGRLLDVALSAAPYLTYATISGSNISVVDNSEDWSDAIKPLDEGDYPLEEFVSALQKIKFKGKTVLHTFGIKNNKNYLSRSLNKWNEMLTSTYNDLNTNINLILDLDPTKVNQLKAELQGNSTWELETLGADPWIATIPLKETINPNATALSFDYFCPKGLDHLQIYFSPEINEAHSKIERKVGMSEGWVPFTIDISEEIGAWGNVGDWLRIDVGGKPNVTLQIRNITFREMTTREKEVAANREEKRRLEAEIEARLKAYLEMDYSSEITQVEVSDAEISVEGNHAKIDKVYLCEVAPYQDVTEETIFETAILVASKKFKKKLDRFVNRNGVAYDRVLSKWVLAKKTSMGYQLVSHAHHPDVIYSKYNYPKEVATSRKGLGGFSTSRGHVEDLDELDITSATINIWFSKFMFSEPAPDRIEHIYNGKSYYFKESDVANFDNTFRTTAEKGIITAAILLVDKAEKCPDPVIGKLLQHPDMDPAGIYAMPNMTNPASVDCYAAALDFLASRYSRPDKKYGRINHWIMHNEVDAGWVWTNMGEKPALVFMDTYIKSMRMCYAIARKYNPHSEVFVTLTHYWAWTSHPKFYPSKDLMEILLQYTKAEGNFEWAMAHHPYPQSLREPKTWLDGQVDFTFESPLITFANLEVIDAWIKLPEVLYKGKTKRTLWLSENGTNSPTYSEQDLKEQAAGFAFTWKKMKALDGIDGFQWHNWFDHRGEGGLRIGLRRFPDDETDPGGTKPVWEVYKAADTENENAVFDQYKEMIGITNWKEVEYKDEIIEK